MDRISIIDTRQGTQNQHTIGHGNTLAYTGVPFGMNHFVLQTRLHEGRFFHPNDYTQFGVRLTHQPSPWMGDFCQVLFNQLIVNEEEYQKLLQNNDEATAINLAMSSYRPDEATFQPHFLSFKRLRDGLVQSWSVGERGARWQTKATRLGKQLLTIAIDRHATVDLLADQQTIKLYTNQLAGSKYHQFGQYSLLKSDQPLKLLTTIDITLDNHASKMIIFEYEVAQPMMECQLSTSYISFEQAQMNFAMDAFYQNDFMASQQLSRQLWIDYLGKVDVSHRNREQVETFYHCLWRTATFPQLAYERDVNNQPIHYSPYTGQVEKGYFYTNNGYWDTFRTNYPLYTLLIPSRVPELIEGIASIVREDRYLPKWLSPDERGLMPGTLVDAVIADAVTKGLVSDELAQELLDAMIDSANHSGTHATEGREGVEEYLALGYLSTNYHESVNKTLDFAYSDFCIHQVAKHLGHEALAQAYLQRSYSYRHLFEKQSKQMKPRTASGEFLTHLKDERWGEHYTEGSAWQNSLAVYHNIADLIALHGGDDAFAQHLERLVNQEPVYDVNGYGYEIHEMTEMARIPFGQLALSNQPSFHIPYLYIYAGMPHLSHLLIKQLATHLFNSSPTGFIGDEDNGSMSAWYVLSSLGFYPVTPGSSEWTLGICLWDHATIYLEDGQTIEIVSTAKQTPYTSVVTKRTINQEAYPYHFIKHQTLMKGLVLEQSLGVVPSMQKVDEGYRPFSVAKK